MSRLKHNVAMRWEIIVPKKHGIEALMLALKYPELKAEAILVHMHQGLTAMKVQEEKN